MTKKTKLTERGLGQAKLTMLIDYYLGDMERRGCSHESVSTNRQTLRRFAKRLGAEEGDLRISDVELDDAEQYVTQLQKQNVRWKNHPTRQPEKGGLSPFTIRKEVRILKGFGTWLDSEGFENPFNTLVVPREPKRLVKVLNDEEIEHVLDAINPYTKAGSRLYAIVLFLLDSGPRISEVATARVPDLDLEKRQIRVIGKGDKERIVPFGTRTGRAFLRYIHTSRPQPALPDYDQIFLSLDGLPLTRHGIDGMMWRLKRSSGVKRLHAHLFRHTFAVRYLMNGGDIVTLQRILGHESLEVTKRYLSLSTAQVQLRYDAHSPVDRLDVGGLRRFGNKRHTKYPA